MAAVAAAAADAVMSAGVVWHGSLCALLQVLMLMLCVIAVCRVVACEAAAPAAAATLPAMWARVGGVRWLVAEFGVRQAARWVWRTLAAGGCRRRQWTWAQRRNGAAMNAAL